MSDCSGSRGIYITGSSNKTIISGGSNTGDLTFTESVGNSESIDVDAVALAVNNLMMPTISAHVIDVYSDSVFVDTSDITVPLNTFNKFFELEPSKRGVYCGTYFRQYPYTAAATEWSYLALEVHPMFCRGTFFTMAANGDGSAKTPSATDISTVINCVGASRTISDISCNLGDFTVAKNCCVFNSTADASFLYQFCTLPMIQNKNEMGRFTTTFASYDPFNYYPMPYLKWNADPSFNETNAALLTNAMLLETCYFKPEFDLTGHHTACRSEYLYQFLEPDASAIVNYSPMYRDYLKQQGTTKNFYDCYSISGGVEDFKLIYRSDVALPHHGNNTVALTINDISLVDKNSITSSDVTYY